MPHKLLICLRCQTPNPVNAGTCSGCGGTLRRSLLRKWYKRKSRKGVATIFAVLFTLGLVWVWAAMTANFHANNQSAAPNHADEPSLHVE